MIQSSNKGLGYYLLFILKAINLIIIEIIFFQVNKGMYKVLKMIEENQKYPYETEFCI